VFDCRRKLLPHRRGNARIRGLVKGHILPAMKWGPG
jgi:hypothetical protein